WNRKYMEISFHVIITVLILAGMAALLFWLPGAKNVIFETARGFLAVFAPVFWALFFSLLLEPLTNFCQKFYESRCSLYHRSHIKNRKTGTALAYLSVGLFLFLLGRFFAKKIGDTDIQSIAAQIGDYIRRIGDILVLLNLKLAEMGILSNVEGLLSLWTEQMTLWIESKIIRLANGIPNIGGSLLDILIGLAAAFYFLMEKQRILSICSSFSVVLLGKKRTGYLKRLFHEVYFVFAGYLSGQMLDAAIMAVLFSGAFLIVGLPHAVFLGLLSGFSNLIPYFGAITAFIFAVFSGLLSGTPAKALYASILILLLQQIDSILIVPKAVGKRVELHPVLVILSLAVFGRLFGFWGLLFAVPLGALCKNFLYWLYERKKTDICQ
ncbi:MAG: AI-2E family transporter, partial [Anaerotignum sp.]|nr:AI-2E family transporter [Anaerotignum sp.]